MLTEIPGLPAHVVGLHAEGEVTAVDYSDVLEPLLASRASDGNKISVLYVMDDGTSYSAGALAADAKVGAHGASGFNRIAVVTDDGRFHAAVAALSVFMPGRVRYFAHADRAEAETWVSATD